MEKLILSEDEIVRVCNRLANEIDRQIEKNDNGVPVILGIMNGAMPFMFELVKHIQHPVILDTLKASSYEGISSSGDVHITKEPDNDLTGRDVCLIEDIIDTGTTMHFLKQYISEKYHPKNLYVVVLIKRHNHQLSFDEKADFTGLETEEQRYIVGYGFDYYSLYRNVPYIFVPSEKDIQEWTNILQEDEALHPQKK